MTKLISVSCDPTNTQKSIQQIADAIGKGCWVQLLTKKKEPTSIPHHLLPKGPGVIISSGGSFEGPHQCLQPCTHLDQSAKATGEWLLTQDIKPENCLILNPLPLHHVSGLMPWWRSRVWDCNHAFIPPSLMRDPIALEEFYKALFCKRIGALVISLVPTQLQRLIDNSAGLRWLKSFDVIWIGGSALSDKLAANARSKNIYLAPCYGSTETAAMVTILAPHAFLAGERGCGHPLKDVQLRLNKMSTLEVKSSRLALARWEDGQLKKLEDVNGWWQSGDAANLTLKNGLHQVEIIGRVDTAIHSGGETIFPEKLEARLLNDAKRIGLTVQSLIFIPIKDKEWGERLICLVRWQQQVPTNEQQKQFQDLTQLVKSWDPAERPLSWHRCPQLAPNAAGKWERSKWKSWWEATNKYLNKD